MHHCKHTLIAFPRDQVSSLCHNLSVHDRVFDQAVSSPAAVLSLAVVFSGQGSMWSFNSLQGWTRPLGWPLDDDIQVLSRLSVVLSLALEFSSQGWRFYHLQGWTRPQGRPPDSIQVLHGFSVVFYWALAFGGQGSMRSSCFYFLQGWARPPGRK